MRATLTGTGARKTARITRFARHPLPAEFPVHVWVRHLTRDGSEHHRSILGCHNGLEIGYCHQGEGVFPVGDRFLPFGPRYVSVVPPMTPHGTWSREGTESTWSYFLTDPARLLAAPGTDYTLFDTTAFSVPGFPNLLSPTDHPEIETLVAQILRENERRDTHYEEAIRAYFRALLVELNRVAGRARRRSRAVRTDLFERIRPALRHIQHNYGDTLSVDALADLCHMSKSNFHRTFKRVMGKGPREHLTQYRVTMACLDLTENRKSVEAIAWDNGFGTVTRFAANFKQITGMTPRAWGRKQATGS
ncbi:MAG: helix-turn-helix transcriptional regulator [Kiritimatiellae bacterium]|nr:helix-turn-helix transcriptional regulator [Kiritimatiellia bacterium]